MNYREHREKLLKDNDVKKAYERRLPEYDLAKSIIEQRIKDNITFSKTHC